MANDDKNDGTIHKLQHNAFVADVIATNDQNRAYRNVYDRDGLLSDKTIARNASRLMDLPHIAEAIANHRKSTIEKAQMTALEVMQEFIDIVRADPTKIIQYRKHNCRHCHGHDFNYQWIDDKEWCAAVIAAQHWNANKSPKAPPREMPLDIGGYGFDPKQRPHVDCPHCAGDGHPSVWIADTRDLCGPEKRLFAGIKQTQNGMQILMRDQDATLKNLAAVMGMFVDRLIINPTKTNDDATVPTNPEEAAMYYQTMIKRRHAGN